MYQQRDVTPEEIEKIKKIYSFYFPNYWLRFLLFLALGIVLSLLFFLALFFDDHKSVADSIQFGLIAGYGFILFFIIINTVRKAISNQKGEGDTFKNRLKKDVKEKKAVIKNIETVKVWQVFDPSYNKEKPDFLFKTKDGGWICVPWEDITDADNRAHPKSIILLHLLKNSRLDIKVEFDGGEVPLSKKTIGAHLEWRNDDLPYNKVFKTLPERIKIQLY